MANKRVTDLETIATAPISGVMHFVDTTDSTQNAAGSSFKVTKEDFLKENTAAILLNTSKVGFTDALVGSAPTVTANTAKVGITTGQASAIVTNTAKVSFDSTSSTRLANTSGTNTGDQDLSGKQDTLISATNIKTINGATLLGSGDLLVSGGANTVNLTGAQTVADKKTFTSDTEVNGLTVGKGGSNIATNTALGFNALAVNITGNSNTSTGDRALSANTTGSRNSTCGFTSMQKNTTGQGNSAFGSTSSRECVSGNFNSSFGDGALLNSTGSNNTAFGNGALAQLTTGNNNTSIGYRAGFNVTGSLSSSSDSVFIGMGTKPLALGESNQVVVGFNAVGLGSNTSVLGNSSIVFSRVFGRNLINTSIDNGVDQGQFSGSVICTTLKTSGFTVATLPSPPAQGLGAIAHVTDALNPTYLGTLTGGGTVKCPVFYNGTNWVSS